MAVLTSCQLLEKPRAITLIGSDNKVLGIVIPKSKVREFSEKDIHVRLISDVARTDILGEVKEENDELVFIPVVPLTNGLKYEILAGDNSIGEVEVPESSAERPYLIEIYPTQDTLPENLLKIHQPFRRSPDNRTSFLSAPASRQKQVARPKSRCLC